MVGPVLKVTCVFYGYLIIFRDNQGFSRYIRVSKGL